MTVSARPWHCLSWAVMALGYNSAQTIWNVKSVVAANKSLCWWWQQWTQMVGSCDLQFCFAAYQIKRASSCSSDIFERCGKAWCILRYKHKHKPKHNHNEVHTCCISIREVTYASAATVAPGKNSLQNGTSNVSKMKFSSYYRGSE